MTVKPTTQWMIKTARADQWALKNKLVVLYPKGLHNDLLSIPPGENVCMSMCDTLYLSTEAVYVRDNQGKCTRIPWLQIEGVDEKARKVGDCFLQTLVYRTVDGRKVVSAPFKDYPWYFAEVHDTCIAEFGPKSKMCELPGPIRFDTHAIPAPEGTPWTASLTQDKSLWFRELVCPCGSKKGFALRFLGRLLKNGKVADGKLRQRVVAECNGCGDACEVFDSFRNGYNAVICRESEQEPPGREAKTPYQCKCGKNHFGLGVAAVFDADSEDLRGLRKDKRSEAYGWFAAYATCRKCDRVTQVVGYETA